MRSIPNSANPTFRTVLVSNALETENAVAAPIVSVECFRLRDPFDSRAKRVETNGPERGRHRARVEGRQCARSWQAADYQEERHETDCKLRRVAARSRVGGACGRASANRQHSRQSHRRP